MLRKTYLLAISFICILTIQTTAAQAGPCADAGYTIGQACPGTIMQPFNCVDLTNPGGVNRCKMFECSKSCDCLVSKLDCPTTPIPPEKCDPCPLEGFWGPVFGKNYESQTSYSQNTITCTCTAQEKYRCRAGYYSVGLTTIYSIPDCSECPEINSTSFAGSSSISNCYIPARKSISDTVGTYEYTNSCYYTD